MKISTKGRYALRVMVDLAAHADESEYIRLKDISQRNNGGYRLAKDPKEYTVGDVLRTTEGSIAPIACLDDEPNQCERASQCTTLPFWEGLWNVIREYVDGVTVADLLEQSKSCLEDDK